MKITFLGTAAGVPSRSRNVSSLALQFVQQGTLWMFDCGEGTQHQVLKSPLSLNRLERIFITHLHGDHIYGLLGLLASRALQAGADTPVTLYGPNGLAQYLKASMDATNSHFAYPVIVETISEGLVYEDAHCQVFCKPTRHRVESFGYAIIERDRPGHFDASKAAALGIPSGPLYGKLKNGESITLSDGTIVNGTDLCGPTRPGCKLVYTGDTAASPIVVELARNADVLIHEATFIHEHANQAEKSAHSTSVIAARAALEANAKMLILTHFSSRYESGDGPGLDQLLAEARAIFPNTHLAYDFWTYELPQV